MAKTKHTIRIISGTHRSRRLPILAIDGLRPTGDRVRETLFNWLQMKITGKNTLDLCAGSGALGFEAASRGAKRVTMVEKNTNATHQLSKIKESFKFDNVLICNTSAQQFLNRCNEKFDLVFLDPPFAANIIQELTNQVNPMINPGGFIYREAPIDTELQQMDESWDLYRQKSFGQVKIELWQKI